MLVRILHPDVYRRYARDNAPLLGAAGDAVPRIFSHGAFRFGHAMTRDNYVVNDKAPAGQEMARAFSLSSRHSPTRLPMTPEWVVDWDLFFEGGTQRPNLTHRIGPHYPRVFDHTGLFFISPEGGKGLAERDLVSAALAELPKVSTLYGDLMTRAGLAAASPSFADVIAPMDAWLMSKVPDAGERAIIAADPPLAFFVLFEAGLAPSNGRHLGPFGSIIIAEALFRPLRAFKSKLGGAATLKQRIAAGNGLLPGKPDALKLLTGAAVPEIDTMPKLIAFVKSHDGFPPVVQSNHG